MAGEEAETVGRTPRPTRAGLADLAASWFSNKAAARCEGVRWPLAAALVLAATMAVALPFGAARWRQAAAAADLSRYPGLGAAFVALAAQPGGFAVGPEGLSRDAALPTELRAGAWTVYVDRPGLPEEADGKALWLGSEYFAASNPETGAFVASAWTPFEGLSSARLRAASGDLRTMGALIEGMFFTAAFSGMSSSIASLGLLMLVQNLFFVAIIGLLLSLSALRSPDPAERRVRPLLGMKLAACVTAGPAFLVGLLGLALPSSAAPLLWIAYSLLGGVRAVILYMERYRGAAGLKKA